MYRNKNENVTKNQKEKENLWIVNSYLGNNKELEMISGRVKVSSSVLRS